MQNTRCNSEIGYFIRWTLEQDDIELLDDAKRFLRQLYIFAKMRYGGQEYACQQELFQLIAERLIRRAETIDRYMIPLELRIIATTKRTDRMILDLARSNAALACELMGLEPITDCPQPCHCAQSSVPPT